MAQPPRPWIKNSCGFHCYYLHSQLGARTKFSPSTHHPEPQPLLCGLFFDELVLAKARDRLRCRQAQSPKTSRVLTESCGTAASANLVLTGFPDDVQSREMTALSRALAEITVLSAFDSQVSSASPRWDLFFVLPITCDDGDHARSRRCLQPHHLMPPTSLFE